MSKKMKIKLLPNGEIQMETIGVKGKKCLDCVEVLKKLGIIVDEDFWKICLEKDFQYIRENGLEVTPYVEEVFEVAEK